MTEPTLNPERLEYWRKQAIKAYPRHRAPADALSGLGWEFAYLILTEWTEHRVLCAYGLKKGPCDCGLAEIEDLFTCTSAPARVKTGSVANH